MATKSPSNASNTEQQTPSDHLDDSLSSSVVPVNKANFWTRHPVLLAQLRGFAVVAVICTAVSVLIFAALRPSLGTQWANAISLVLCSVLNTELNRRISFGVKGKKLWWRDQRRGLWVMLLALGITSGSLGLLNWVAPHASILAELVVILLGNIASAVTRFVLMRYWIFRRLRKSQDEEIVVVL